ncbi:MAG TPA: zf-HC2 domain-containing protein [Thermodesulfobacteriota bacterium]|nr:zf-HC2 domain-containing protein [Thermodesulfobacteriota bacterium]
MNEMNCDKCSELLIEYMDGELSPEEAALVRSHVEACPECLREYEDYAEIRRTASEHAHAPELSPETVSALVRTAKDSVSRDRKPFWKRFAFSPFLVPALSSAIALSVWFYYGSTGTHTPTIDTASRNVLAERVEEPMSAGSGADDMKPAAQAPKRERSLTPDKELRARSYGEADAMTERKAAAPATPPAPMAARGDAAPAESARMSTPEEIRKMEAPSGAEREEMSALEDSSENETAALYSADASGEYDEPLKTALRRQKSGDCATSIRTLEGLLASRPEPPLEVQTVSYRSLAECYEEKGDFDKAVYSYECLARLSPEDAPHARARIAELKKAHGTVAATPAPTVTPVN